MNSSLENYQFQKFELTKQRNNIKSNIAELEEKLRKFPDYEKLLKELEDCKLSKLIFNKWKMMKKLIKKRKY